ncbi:hypothetical protein C5C36_10740 [Rathayibacter sp. AY1G1]|nr:hypothetical protein C5C46_03070 [Rathayibacter sp. AY1E6]PPG22018.1 hypothetical protein C5C74_03545 [Rathayibacter sp. AY1E8]PPG44866.1 hypothetical protein C5C30_01275 [Rathayibacter sp. AY2B5]PPH07111.1 hypothetical protein C5C33_08940 [Rathayibacter sp. AY1H3]PPH11874.1 hypothetical protein C5C36_10740 [Rathayibacter sp. AY1G1]PPH38299.1 hypothetical protein C5C53_05055 [Rathayibacter sp. AY1E3]PPH41298.1 hypothetical protein C5C86_08055 [Rathayibacter sp. AY1E4]PPH49316.1 hypothetic
MRAYDRGVSTRKPSRATAARYPSRDRARMALAPGILGAIVLLAGLALVGSDAYDFIRYPVAILAAVIGWFAIQARALLWLIGLVPVLVLWNPVLPFAFPDAIWFSLSLAAVGVFVAAGLVIRVPTPE